jgi:dephospho-CoA kinase
MIVPAILVVTGASGVGKTALVHALEAQAKPGVRCYYFDSVGVPSLSEMMADYGSPQAWQVATTHQWIATLATNRHACRVAVLEGQVRPSVVQQAFEEHQVRLGRVVLVECEPATRDARLPTPQQQSELAAQQMAAWAAYLRGQADALQLPVLDTTTVTLEAGVRLLAAHVEALEQASAALGPT